MANVERSRKVDLLKKADEGQDMSKTVTQFRHQHNQKVAARRNMVTNTQAHNKHEISVKEERMRHFADMDREENRYNAMASVEKALYIERLEKEETARKNGKYRRELEQLIAERAKQKVYAGMPVTSENLSQLRLKPEQVEKLLLQEPSPKKY